MNRMLKIEIDPSFKKRKKRDLIVLPFWQGDKKPLESYKERVIFKELNLPLSLQDFSGKEGETLLLYTSTEVLEKRVLLLGLGKENNASLETFRRAGSTFFDRISSFNVSNAALLPPRHSKISQEEIETAFLEGLLLGSYSFSFYKKGKSEKKKKLKNFSLIGSPLDVVHLKSIEKILESVFFARDLVIKSADEVTPTYLAEKAHALGKDFPEIEVKVLNKRHIKKENMGLLMAVSRGASEEPKLITLSYQGNKKTKKHTALVGKGVTFDTGGLNLKGTGSIENQRVDMAGGAAAMGVIRALAALKVKANVTAIIPATENSISGMSYKPGDVYKGLSGKTVEIGNTDAEGRLILADAITYAITHFKPTRIIDLATLTGAMIIALGSEVSGLFSNDDELAKSLIQAGEKTYERLWRMPLYKEYRKSLDSEVADIISTGGKGAGSVTAALFLQEFVQGIPWAHIDIAGTASLPSKNSYLPKQGTGVMVRLLTRFFQEEERKEA